MRRDQINTMILRTDSDFSRSRSLCDEKRQDQHNDIRNRRELSMTKSLYDERKPDQM